MVFIGVGDAVGLIEGIGAGWADTRAAPKPAASAATSAKPANHRVIL